MKITVYNEDLRAWLCYCGSRPLWTTDYTKARQYTTAQGAAIQAQYKALGVHLTLDFVGGNTANENLNGKRKRSVQYCH